MFVSRFIVGALLAGALWPAGARAAAGACSLDGKYRVTSVAAYRTGDTGGGYVYTDKLRGAEVQVAAQPGLTREWLQKTLQDEIAANSCDFGATAVTVEVLSSGPGFAIILSSKDEHAAGEILHHAQQLAPAR